MATNYTSIDEYDSFTTTTQANGSLGFANGHIHTPVHLASLGEALGDIKATFDTSAAVGTAVYEEGTEDYFLTYDTEGEGARAFYWYWFIMNVFFIGPTILGNSLIIISLFRFKNLRKIRAYILIGNLAFSDLLVGFVAMPMDIVDLLSDEYSHDLTFCVIHTSVIYTTMGMSVINLFLLSLERYDAIASPFRHARRFTKFRIYVVMVTTWVVVSVIGMYPIFDLKHTRSSITSECRTIEVFSSVYKTIFLSLALGSITLSTLFFIIIVRKATRTMKQCDYSDGHVIRRRIHKDIRHTRNMLIITGLFIIFWGPFCVVSLIPQPSPTMLLVKTWLSSFGVINSCLNWIVYGARCTKFRAAFASILNCRCAQKTYKLPPTST